MLNADWGIDSNASVQVRALNPPHAATDGLISKGFFVYFHPIDSPYLHHETSHGSAFLIDYKIATKSLIIDGLSIVD